MPDQPRIAIVGAGPAGLALGALLQKQNVAFTMFERRPRPTPEELAAPSGMLDLHEESGLAAVEACGLAAQFASMTSDCAQSMVIIDRDGNTVYADGGDHENRPEIARHALVGLLLGQVDGGRIRWEHKLQGAAETPTGAVVLDFGAHGAQTFDFVVGADGAWSRIRPLVAANAQPEYAGLQYVTVTIRAISTRFPALAAMLGRGTAFVLGGGAAVIGHRGAGDTARLCLAVGGASADMSVLDGAGTDGDTPDIKQRLLSRADLFGCWGAATKQLIAAGLDDEAASASGAPRPPLAAKPMYRLAAGHAWTSRPCATLVGDAAHLMLPFAGEGVNLALWDAWDLSKVLVAAVEAAGGGGGDSASFRHVLAGPLAAWEARMAARAKDRAAETDRNCGILFAEDGATRMAALMDGLLEGS